MAIWVKCSCGKQLKAKDEAAGRRLRCPACETVVNVPAVPELPRPEITSQPAEPVAKAKRWMVWIPFVAAGVLALAIIPFALPRRPETRPAGIPVLQDTSPTSEQPASTSPDVPSDGGRLRVLLAKADLAHAEDERHIAQITANMIDAMSKANQELTAEEALEGSLRWTMPGYFAHEKPPEFMDYAKMYMMTRQEKGMTHRQTIRSLHGLARALYPRSEDTSESEFEAAFRSASPGCQMAIAEVRKPIPGNDPVAEYYGEVAKEVANAYGMAEQEVSAAVAYVVVELANTDQDTAPDQILLAALDWTRIPEARSEFYEFLELYVGLRQQKKSHAVACEILCGKRPDDALPEPVTP